jgi:hypothetical protein
MNGLDIQGTMGGACCWVSVILRSCKISATRIGQSGTVGKYICHISLSELDTLSSTLSFNMVFFACHSAAIMALP